ncbi:hypothetical protein [Methylomonas koyamae]|uniref:hypothetical protein n=1 Tax=Methylomonas koyamae TaxID=702114 RepID=UPI0006D26401|nr:hypothetical protein [Methylomonas koyamae]
MVRQRSATRTGEAWFFDTALGSQQTWYKKNLGSDMYVWAVRDGDIAAVPLPGAVWLFASAVFGGLFANRRKSN